MDIIVVILIIIAIFFLSFYSGIEVAFSRANRLGIELSKKQGSPAGVLISRLLDEPVRFIGTVITGYNFFLVVFVLLVSTFWHHLLDKSDIIKSFLLPTRLILEIILSMTVVLLLGEFIPKAIFRAKSDTLLNISAKSGLLGISHDIFYPIARVMVSISEWILSIIFDVRINRKKDSLSRADLDNIFNQNFESREDHGQLDADLFEAALSLPSVRVRECLIPRKEIKAIEIGAGIEDLRKKFVETGLSKIVVYKGNIDQIIGYAHQLAMFKNPKEIKDILLPIPAIPESMSAIDLIAMFNKERKSIAWVVDEFGGTAGIVTMEDMLEEIFGDIRDEFDVEEFEEKKISDEEFIFSGRLELDYLREKFGLDFRDNDSETLSGYIIHQYESIPKPKERIIIDDYEFEILQVSDTRIEMVRLKILN
jgi:putative hemolysin